MEENRIWKQTKNTDNIIKLIEYQGNYLRKTHIINNQSLFIEPLSHTISLRVIHMYTYFILFFTLLYTREVTLTSIEKHVKRKACWLNGEE